MPVDSRSVCERPGIESVTVKANGLYLLVFSVVFISVQMWCRSDSWTALGRFDLYG